MFSLIGSCVTRDAVEMMKNKSSLEKYFARTSICSLMNKSKFHKYYSTSELRDKELGNFQKRVLIADLNKTALNDLISSESKNIIIDFIDERFSLLTDGMGGIITKSNYLLKSDLLNSRKHNYKIELTRKQTITHNLFDESLRKFVQFLKLNNFSIIIHKALYAEKYINEKKEVVPFENETELKVINENNDFLKKYYNLFEAYCFLENVPCEIVEITEEKRYSAFAHKWGRDYFHFDDVYYEELADKLDNLID